MRASGVSSSASEAGELLDSNSEADVRPQRARKLHLICPGGSKELTDMTKLRQHRAAYRTADPASSNAANKRPRTVRRDNNSARDADDRIQQMMGNRSGSELAVRDAQSPFLQPRDEVGPGDSNGLTRPWSRTFAQCLQNVYSQFVNKI
jgi:hypothetical protein